jgi:hypothetical protein
MSDEVRPWDLINGSPRAPEEIAEERLAICKGCEFFRKGNQSCNTYNTKNKSKKIVSTLLGSLCVVVPTNLFALVPAIF